MLDNSTKAFVQAYNVQLAVDAKSQLIVAGLVSNQAADSPHLPDLLAKIKENLGRFPREVSADAGYFNDDNLKFLYGHEIEGYLAFKKIKHGEKLPPAPRGRIPVNLSLKDRMRRKLCTKKGQQRYALRKITVEPVIGQIKRILGFVQFLTRGLKNVMAEWDWVMLAHNLRKLWGKRTKLLPSWFVSPLGTGERPPHPPGGRA